MDLIKVVTPEHIQAVTEGGVVTIVMVIFSITILCLFWMCFYAIRKMSQECHRFQEQEGNNNREMEDRLANKMDSHSQQQTEIIANQKTFQHFVEMIERRIPNE